MIIINSVSAASSVSSSRRSTQHEELLTNIAAIKTAAARIENYLKELGTPASSSRATSPSNDNDYVTESFSESAESADLETSDTSVEAISRIYKGVYLAAIAQIKSVAPIEFKDTSTAEMIPAGQRIQIILNPNQVIANELASFFVRNSNSSQFKYLEGLVIKAELESASLVQEHAKLLKSKIYKTYVDGLKNTQHELTLKIRQHIIGIIYAKSSPELRSSEGFKLSTVGDILINSFYKELTALKLYRQYGVDKYGKPISFKQDDIIQAGSIQEDTLIHAIALLTMVLTSQLDFNLSGVSVPFEMLMKTGIHPSEMSHSPYAVQGGKLYTTTFKDGVFVENKESTAAVLTDTHQYLLKGIFYVVIKEALRNCKFKSPKFGVIRQFVNSKADYEQYISASEEPSDAEE